MNVVDGLVLALLAVADMALLVHLRRSRTRRLQAERMMLNLQIAVERAILEDEYKLPPRVVTLRRAS